MTELPFAVHREIIICAERATVFAYFTDAERWARWWGAGSRIDARPGGEVLICYPGGATARGNVVDIAPPDQIRFTYGYDRPDAPIAPGASVVVIALSDAPGGTRVALRHEVATEAIRDEHVAGWRHQMAAFAHTVGIEHDAAAVATIDRYFAAWSERDPGARRASLAATCAGDVVYRDRHGISTGIDDLDGHIAAAQIHLPGRLARDGDARVSLGVALVDWTASADAGIVARGTSVVELAPGGRIARVTGFWAP